MLNDLKGYLREDKMSHILCPGCGHGTIMNALVHAIDELKLDQDKTVIVSGIGCSSRIPGYLNFNTLHTTHGRAIAFATGIKLANPELKVIVITGDGDASAIGGNHLIHACRRNIDITAIVFNNNIYGMTSGQFSPMTPIGSYATTAPYGNIDRGFDLCDLSKGAGATFVARGTAYHVSMLQKLIVQAIEAKGFSMLDAISHCPTYYGRKNRLKDGIAMLEWEKEQAMPVKAFDKLPKEKTEGKFPIGVIYQETAPEYCEVYQEKVIDVAQKEGK
ncbi:MAG: 2-oxoacid:ferredoxin oxidoreductase subunit beta [Clostridia bacterium]